MSNRDEQLEALEAAVKSAESKLKNAEMSVEDIEKKIKSADEAFERKLAEKAAGYKEQTGADFSRTVDENGKVTYSFSREATEKEYKNRRNLTIKRQFDRKTGKVQYKAELTDNSSQNVSVNSTKDFQKPENRKKYIAFNFFGYRKLELSTEVNNPFLNTVGKPIIVPIQAAAKLIDKTGEVAKKVSESSVGKGVSGAAKIISAPIVIPARIVKDIADKGGVIHAVVDLGDKIKIEGVNAPEPLKKGISGVAATAKGAETLTVGAVKGMGKFSVEIAKEKLYEEIHKGISENEGTQAAYVIGIRAIDVYKVLHEHTKYKKAVKRDKAGNDVSDVNVSRYLAEKEDNKYQKKKDGLSEEKKAADYSAYNARKEYEAAKARLENYQRSKGIPVPEAPKAPISEIVQEKPKLTKTEKKIEKTKLKLRSVQNHKYKLKRQKVFDEKKGKVVSKIGLARVEVTGATPMTAWQTKKKLEGLAVRDTAMSMRRKAMRDGGDNAGVEAANFAITASQSAKRFIKTIDSKEKAFREKRYEQKLHELENKKGLENVSENSKKPYEKSEKKSPESKMSERKKKRSKSESKQQQKRQIKKKHQKKVYKKKKSAASEVANDVKNFIFRKIKGIGIVLALIAAVILFPVLGLTMCGGGTSLQTGMGTATAILISPCDTVDLGLCDLYYTELAKNMIDVHQNIENHYVDYDKYVCLTEINKITHSPEKLLPCVAVNTLSGSGEDEWNFEQAKPYIENIFNEQYKFYTNEKIEIRKAVSYEILESNGKNRNEYFSLGGSYFTLYGREYYSSDYKSQAHTYTPIEIVVDEGYTTKTLDNVGKYTNKDGYTEEYDDAQTLTFSNHWTLKLVFEWDYDNYIYNEYWIYTEEEQKYTEYEYKILEYAIRENTIDVDEIYWTDTDESWQDNNFDKLIYNRVLGMTEEEKELFDGYYEFNMGHQELKNPYADAQIAKYPGYNNDIYGDMSLENSIVLYSSAGQKILCGMDGEITVIDNGFSVYNEKFGTLYYEGAAISNTVTGKKGEPIATATGDKLKITFIDNDGNYLNPLFIFSE